MYKVLILFSLLINTHAVFSKTETELKVALTKSGFESLKNVFINNYEAEESVRSDFYFDTFVDGRYVLRHLDQPIKLRFMWNGEMLKWQNLKVIKTGFRSIFSIKTSESSELEINYEKSFFETIDLYFQKLVAVDAYAMTLAAGIQNHMVKNGVLTDDGLRYFPTHSNYKKRFKIKLKIESDQFNVQIGETVNRGVSSYELEAEVKKSTDINKSADRLNNWLQTKGFIAAHIDITTPVDPALFSEKLLNEFFVIGVENF